MIEHRWQLWLIGWAALGRAPRAALSLAAPHARRDCRRRRLGRLASCCARSSTRRSRPGDLAHRLAIALPVGLENLRIASLVRNRLGKGEDSRYQELRRRWREKGREQLTFAIFYQAQALLAAILSRPGRCSRASTATPRSRPSSGSGSRSGSSPPALEATADRQLAAFKARPREPRRRDGSRPLALLAPPELLLPDADLGRLRAHRRRRRRGAGSPSSHPRSSSTSSSSSPACRRRRSRRCARAATPTAATRRGRRAFVPWPPKPSSTA